MVHLLSPHTGSEKNGSVIVGKTDSLTVSVTVTFPSRIVISGGILPVTVFIMDTIYICWLILKVIYQCSLIIPVHQSMTPLNFCMLSSG